MNVSILHNLFLLFSSCLVYIKRYGVWWNWVVTVVERWAYWNVLRLFYYSRFLL